MKNIELKISLDNFKGIISLLKKLGAKYKGKSYQIDTYYNYKKGRLKIREADNKNFSLIFYQRPNKANSKTSYYQILNIQAGKLKNTKSVLRDTFGEKIIVTKERNFWMYKNTRIYLDKVKILGNFLELETMVKKITFKQAKKEHKEVMRFLGLSRYKKQKDSYSDMLLRFHQGKKSKKQS